MLCVVLCCVYWQELLQRVTKTIHVLYYNMYISIWNTIHICGRGFSVYRSCSEIRTQSFEPCPRGNRYYNDVYYTRPLCNTFSIDIVFAHRWHSCRVWRFHYGFSSTVTTTCVLLEHDSSRSRRLSRITTRSAVIGRADDAINNYQSIPNPIGWLTSSAYRVEIDYQND